MTQSSNRILYEASRAKYYGINLTIGSDSGIELTASSANEAVTRIKG